jgi:pimeloyl-ACP methyl ester carboxylesterase
MPRRWCSLHGYMATLMMWSLNIVDFSKNYRLYAVDVMGQPGKSIPDEPIRNAADFVAWLTATLDALHLARASLVGMSFGAWLTLNYAVAAPEQLHKIVLLSPAASLLQLVKQFSLRGMLMLLFPTRLTVNSFMRWLTFKENLGDPDTRRIFDSTVNLMYLGLKHIRLPQETLRIVPNVLSDDELRAMRVPTLVLIGDHEAMYDSAMALARARRLIPYFEGDFVARSNHDMAFSQHPIVDARILDFLRKTPL